MPMRFPSENAAPAARPEDGVSDRVWALGLIGLTFAAAVLRFWRLGTWPFYGDEASTFLDSTMRFSWSDLRPLAAAFNHYVTIPLLGPNELAIRIAPFLAGVAFVPLAAVALRRWYGRAAGLAAAAVMAFSPVLLVHSQFGRYYMQGLLLSGALLVSLRRWVEGRDWRWAVTAAAMFLLGWFTVPSTSFVLSGFALWALCYPRASGLLELLTIARRRPVLAVAVIALALATAWWLVYRMQTASNDRLLADIRYFSPSQLVLGLISTITPSIVLAAVAGFFLVWRDKALPPAERGFLPLVTVGTLLTFAAAFPFLAVGPAHVLSASATIFALAGYLLALLWRETRPGWAGAVAAAVLVLSSGRELASHLLDGSRVDYRPLIAQMRERQRSSPGPVFATSHAVVDIYAPELSSRELIADPDSLSWLRDPARTQMVWVLMGEHRTGPDVPEDLLDVSASPPACRLVARTGRERVDYHLNAARLYECPAPRMSTP